MEELEIIKDTIQQQEGQRAQFAGMPAESPSKEADIMERVSPSAPDRCVDTMPFVAVSVSVTDLGFRLLILQTCKHMQTFLHLDICENLSALCH